MARRRRLAAVVLASLICVAAVTKVVWDPWAVNEMTSDQAVRAAWQAGPRSETAEQAALKMNREARQMILGLQDLEHRGNAEAPRFLVSLRRMFEDSPDAREIVTQIRSRIARGDTDEELLAWIRANLR